MNNSLRLSDFDYRLPRRLIAQYPAARRDESRLLVLNRKSNRLRHKRFKDIIDYLRPGDVLVMNDAKVIPARIRAERKSGGQVEVLIIEGWRGPGTKALLKPARRIKIGEELRLPGGWRLHVHHRKGQVFTVEFLGDGDFGTFLERWGEMPLPPYIHRGIDDRRAILDKHRYQTVFASHPGAVAAPTAGLHFTRELLSDIERMGIDITFITLWVGWGTFRPVKAEYIADHKMEREYYSVPAVSAETIQSAKQEGRRIVAVGTTTTRALESWIERYPDFKPVERDAAEIFIFPGFQFRIIDALVTNFHLPGSTLLMLLSAFAGRRRILDAYRIAVRRNYRFYSYGDAMLVL